MSLRPRSLLAGLVAAALFAGCSSDDEGRDNRQTGKREREQAAMDRARTDMVSAVSGAIPAMFSLPHDSYDEAVEDALRVLTPSYAQEYRTWARAMRGRLVRSRTDMDGSMYTAGVMKAEPERGEVLAFAWVGADEADGESISSMLVFRFTMVPGDRRWLVDGMQLVNAEVGVEEPDPDRSAALDAARQAGIALTTIDYRDVESHLDRLSELSTGRFEEFVEDGSEIRRDVERSRSVRAGNVHAVALKDFDDDSAKVLVAAYWEGTNRYLRKPSISQKLFTVDLELVDGRWLISNVSHVPLCGYFSGPGSEWDQSYEPCQGMPRPLATAVAPA